MPENPPLSFFQRALGAMGFRKSAMRRQAFWDWFQRNEERLFTFQSRSAWQAINKETAAELEKVHPDLTYECGGVQENGRREFAIGANGDATLFPEVEALCAVAPSLPRWNIVKFRQPREAADLAFHATLVEARSLKVAAKPGRYGINLVIYVPGYTVAEHEGYRRVVSEMLVQALGEYDRATRIDKVELQTDDARKGKTCSLLELPHALDAISPRS
ncbi:MAG: hypothetical protein ABSH39_08165 [Candidatus Acidiferrum sp.]|jgi:hypothetical protein